MNQKKYLLLIALVLTFAFLLSACVGETAPPTATPMEQPPSGEQPTDEVVPVSDVLANPNNFDKVTLRGQITGQIEGKRYNFSDDSGSIQLEIDSNISYGDPPMNKTVIVYGDVETEDGVIQVDVRSLELAE